VAIIALFYTSNISLMLVQRQWLLLFSLNRAGVTRLLPYLLTGSTVVFHASVRRACHRRGYPAGVLYPAANQECG
jgi:Na+/H+ antiporter NhaA